MAKFTWYDGNQGFYRLRDFRDYDVVSSDLSGATLIYGAGGFDPTRSAWRIELTFTDAAEHTFESGPDAGTTIFSSGTISKVEYFNASDELILKIGGTDVDLAGLSAVLHSGNDDLNWLGHSIWSGKNKFIGSADSMNIPDNWDGDSIQTGFGKDVVKAKGGDDFIEDLYGKDNYNGGNGWDTLSYEASYWRAEYVKHGIDVDLREGKITGYDGYVDKVKNVEGVRGSFLKDKLRGDGGDNEFMGLGGNDFINGRGGFDTASYRNDARYGGTDGIIANLKEGTVRDGFGNTDKIRNIERIDGTNADDVFIDNKGNDEFRLRDGDDTVYFAKGNDFANAEGSGADLFVFKGNKFGHDAIWRYDDTQGDKLQINNAVSMADLNIYQDGVNAVIEFGSNSVTLYEFDSGDLDASDFMFV